MSEMIEENALMESLEEDMKALKDAGVITDDTEEKEPEEPKDEPIPEPEKEEAPEPEKPDEEPEPKDASAWAKYRREKRELEAENKRLKEAAVKPAVAPEAKAEAKQEATPETTSNPEPDKEKDLAAWLVWNAEEQKNWRATETQRVTKEAEEKRTKELVDGAMQEIESMHEVARKSNPDYDNAISHTKAEYTKALKLLNPQITEKQIKAAIDRETFLIALECNKRGLNLGETLYDAAIERFGYVKAGELQEPSAPSPNLKLINNNKKKSASPLEGGGQRPKGRVTLEAAADMSPAELQALSAEDWNYLKTMGY